MESVSSRHQPALGMHVPDESSSPRASPELDVAEFEGQYFDPTSGLTFLHRAYKKFSTKRGAELSPNVFSSAERQQPLMSVGDRPIYNGVDGLKISDPAAALDLVRFYFDECVVTYRMFHRPTIFAWLETMISNAERNMTLSADLGPAKAATVLSIMAIATFRRQKIRRVASSLEWDERAALAESDPYYSTALRLTNAETGLPRLESVQARLAQVLYLLQTSRMNQGWYSFGTLSLLLLALGLHRGRSRHSKGHPRSPSQDYIQVQCQIRTFWVAYTMDKYLSCVFGRPSHYRDEDIDQVFPDRVNDEDMTPQGPLAEQGQKDCYIDGLIFHAR